MVISSLSSGGAERVASTLANYWADHGWEIVIITLTDADRDFYSVSAKVKRVSIRLVGESHGWFSGLTNNIVRLRALRRALLRENPDIALAFMTTKNILCALACKGTKIVAIGSEHIHPPMHPLGQPWAVLRRLAYPHLAAVTALTEQSAEWIETHSGARKVPVIPNPVPYPLPKCDPMASPTELKVRLGGDKYLLAVGRLAGQKGFDLLLIVFAQLHAQCPGWRLIILGEGPLRGDLEQLCNQLGLSDFVAMPGAVGNVGEWYEAADLYVMSSRFEGFGNTLAEALCYGLSAVSFDCDTGPSDIIRHEVDGLLVENGNVEALTQALQRLMMDQSLRQQFAARAVEARERFSIEKVAGMWEQLFEEVSGE